jgi:hypothetical protein
MPDVLGLLESRNDVVRLNRQWSYKFVVNVTPSLFMMSPTWMPSCLEGRGSQVSLVNPHQCCLHHHESLPLPFCVSDCPTIGKSLRGKGSSMQSTVLYKVRWHYNGIAILDWFLVSSRLGIGMVGAFAMEGLQSKLSLNTSPVSAQAVDDIVRQVARRCVGLITLIWSRNAGEICIRQSFHHRNRIC